MFLLKKITILCGICALVLQLNACASAVFPDIEDEDEIKVGEGGRVIKSLPDEGNSLKADDANAAYEGEENAESEPEVVAESAEEEETAAPEEVTAVKITPVITEENTAEPTDTKVQTAETPDFAELMEMSGPSVSYRLDTIYFDNGSAAVDSKYNAAIRKIVKEAKANNAHLTVYGYASSRTRNTDVISHKMANFKVSMERAENVAAALKRAGMPASKISVEALSDTVPVYLEVMPEGERLNRRAEVYISY